MEWIDIKTIYIIIHLFGVAIGAGGSFMSDVLFISTTKDRVLNKTELGILKLGSLFVWIGLFLLIVSGALLFSLNPEAYMQSDKFILKMIIVLIIAINGIIFHVVHTPRLVMLEGKRLSMSSRFKKFSKGMYCSGAISVVSWISALVLGSLRSIPVNVVIGFSIYLFIVLIAIIGAEFERRKYLNI